METLKILQTSNQENWDYDYETDGNTKGTEVPVEPY